MDILTLSVKTRRALDALQSAASDRAFHEKRFQASRSDADMDACIHAMHRMNRLRAALLKAGTTQAAIDQTARKGAHAGWEEAAAYAA